MLNKIKKKNNKIIKQIYRILNNHCVRSVFLRISKINEQKNLNILVLF